MNARRLATCALVALLVLLPGASVAHGHSSIADTSPASGARLGEPPRTVRVTYLDPLLSVESARVTVRGRSALAGPPRLDASDARRLLIPVLPAGAGRYHADWIVVGPDGHPVSGELSFSVRPRPLALALLRVVAALRRAVDALLDAVPR